MPAKESESQRPPSFLERRLFIGDITMKIKLNGNDHELGSEKSLAELLSELKLPCGGIAVAVNGDIISQNDHPAKNLNDGDCVEVIRAIGGG